MRRASNKDWRWSKWASGFNPSQLFGTDSKRSGVASGLTPGSIPVVGFGIDSLIEVTSGTAALWRMHRDHPNQRVEAERVSLRIVGCCFNLLAAYIAVVAVKSPINTNNPFVQFRELYDHRFANRDANFFRDQTGSWNRTPQPCYAG